MNDKKAIIKVQIINALGLHARPASLFVKMASSFISEINVEKDGEIVNGKSIMGLMILAAAKGSQLQITAIGHDCDAALVALKQLIDESFGEA